MQDAKRLSLTALMLITTLVQYECVHGRIVGIDLTLDQLVERVGDGDGLANESIVNVELVDGFEDGGGGGGGG